MDSKSCFSMFFGSCSELLAGGFSEKSSKTVLVQHLLPEMNLQFLLFEMDFWSCVVDMFLWDLSGQNWHVAGQKQEHRLFYWSVLRPI